MPCPHCANSATVTVFGDYSRQCGQAFRPTLSEAKICQLVDDDVAAADDYVIDDDQTTMPPPKINNKSVIKLAL